MSTEESIAKLMDKMEKRIQGMQAKIDYLEGNAAFEDLRFEYPEESNSTLTTNIPYWYKELFQDQCMPQWEEQYEDYRLRKEFSLSVAVRYALSYCIMNADKIKFVSLNELRVFKNKLDKE